MIAWSPDWVCGLIYVWLYVLLRETTSSCNLLILCFSRENDFVINLLIFFSFHLEVTCYIHVLHWWHRGEQNQSRKPLLYYLLFKEKQLLCEDYFYHVFTIVRGMTSSWILLITIFYSPFLRAFIYLTVFHAFSIFNGFILLVIVMLVHAFIKWHVWIILIRVLCLACLGVTY